ncbi:hypothetical protein [Roseovarius aestuariivivens]|uniref:hypothetical protein n=1 Tax=Roseovarius aestuariivivens TaxID=1888910 RepID=UPI0010821923|nr:hypothetical protein [Roseovarius aestuariivivens]
MPTVLPVHDALWRIYVAGRDARNRGSVVLIEVDPTREMQVLSISKERLVEFGNPGAFDSDGVGVTCAMVLDDKVFFASAGLRCLETYPYQLGIGLMCSLDRGQNLSRVQLAPTLCAGAENPVGCSSAQILRIGSDWHMWFASWRSWSQSPSGEAQPHYDIRHAVSKDLVHWQQDPDPAIALSDSRNEGGLGRPWVMPNEEGYEMWFSARGGYDPDKPTCRNYAIGYATSPDAETWTRRDEAHGFVNPPAPGDWDKKMQCYTTVMRGHGQTYMFYCGNDYGRHGFGYAIRDEGPAT